MSYLELAKQARRNEPEPKEPAPSASPITNIRTARAKTPRTEDERCLLAAGWSPKERCGPLNLTIWVDPETGFYCSQEIALHRLGRDVSAGAGGEGLWVPRPLYGVRRPQHVPPHRGGPLLRVPERGREAPGAREGQQGGLEGGPLGPARPGPRSGEARGRRDSTVAAVGLAGDRTDTRPAK